MIKSQTGLRKQFIEETGTIPFAMNPSILIIPSRKKNFEHLTEFFIVLLTFKRMCTGKNV
jgi:hypothetical protein